MRQAQIVVLGNEVAAFAVVSGSIGTWIAGAIIGSADRLTPDFAWRWPFTDRHADSFLGNAANRVASAGSQR